MKKVFLLLPLVTLLSFLSTKANPYFSIQRLGVERGLSNNYVVSIAQDKQGFLWFATEEGLNKFDGTQFIPYYKSTTGAQALTGNELNVLLDDPTDSILWIGTQRAGLNLYNYAKNEFSCYKNSPTDPNSLITDDITAISPAADGNLWITTYWNGVDYFDKKEQKFIHYNTENVKELVSNKMWCAMDNRDGKLYIGHVADGLTILSIKDKKAKNYKYSESNPTSLPGNEVKCIYKDHYGMIWVGTNHGIALFDAARERFITIKHKNRALSNYIYDIKELENNKLWVAIEFGGIAIIDLSSPHLLTTGEAEVDFIQAGDSNFHLSHATARCLFQDHHKNVWAGVWGGGVNFLSHIPNLFTNYQYSSTPGAESSLNSKVVSSICMDQQEQLWVGTDGGGINVLQEGQSIAIYNQESGHLASNSVQAALCDSNGELWFGFFAGGMCHYDAHHKRFTQLFSSNHPLPDVRVIYEEQGGNLWAGTSEGIYLINQSTKLVVAHYGLENNLVRTLCKDSLGQMWIGTYGGGLLVYDASFQCIKRFNTYNNFPSNTINALFQDSNQQMWVATGEGVVCFPDTNQETYTLYQKAEGLENIHIRAITEDRERHIWVSSNRDISCLMKGASSFESYGKSSNVPIDGFVSNSVTTDEKGQIYFGSLDGLCFFSPKVVLKKGVSPKAIITDMRIFEPLDGVEDQVLYLTQHHKVKLSHEQSSFSVTFNIQNYAWVNQVEYAYMLKGLEDIWYPVQNSNNVTFRNIPPGNYLLQVKTRFLNQEWSNEISQLAIEIKSPLWLTWWAKLLYLTLLLATVAAIIQMYNSRFRAETLYKLEKKKHEQEQELNDERLRFYTNITHELRTPLTLILGPLEDLLKQNSLSPKDGKKVSIIHQSAIRLLNLINQLLEFRKTETQNKRLCVSRDNLTNLIFEIGLKYKELNQNEAVTFSIEASVEELMLFYDKEVLTMILDNLLSNAIKYTPSGHITLSLDTEVKEGAAYATISVSDTGHGIAPEALNSIYDRYYQANSEHQASGTGIGLSLVKNLVALHEAAIEVESQLDKGSCFTVKLLIDNTYPHLLHAEPKVEEEKSEEATEAEPKEVGKRILLVVEDNPDIRSYIADSFAEWFDVRMATNGKEGVEQAFELIPDVIVSDVMMPIMSGTALCEQLKRDVRTSHIPIILLTAKDTLQDKEEGYQAGADSYLTKPFSATLLQSRISNLLDSRKTLANHFGEKSELKEKKSTISSALNKIDDEFLTKINQLIEERMTEDKIEIGYLADKLCMSHSTLYRKMKALTGLSTNEYIRKVKMRHAERLLLEGKYTISEITFKMGFNSSVYFRQCFKEEFGMLPSEYLKKLTKEE